jgi:hypothetical protein
MGKIGIGDQGALRAVYRKRHPGGTRPAPGVFAVINRLLLLTVAGVFAIFPLASGQAPPVNTNSQEQLAALIKEVRDQQAEMAANQAKIDEKLAALTESIRQARIYSSRAGR